MAERFFNTSGPVVAEDHYCIPPLGRLELDEILRLIDAKRYFVLHAPRQTGKTSALLALRDLLNERGAYRCVYTNVEPGQTARGDVAAGMRVLLAELSEEALIALGDGFLDQTWERTLARAGPHGALRQTLRRWCLNDPKPLVLLIDEIDALVGDTLISVLRQLRAGYVNRPAAFPQSVVLCGVRDVRDYPIHSESAGGIVNGGGRIEREYALGRRRTDLLIVWPPVRPGGAADPGTPARRHVVECKILCGSLEATIRGGVEQTLAYMDRCRGDTAHMVVFDRDESKPWEEKLYRREESLDGRAVNVWGT